MRRIPVLIVGGSLTGLSAAVFLGTHAVPGLVVERRDSILAHPKLQGLVPRAMELYRQAGLEPDIRAVAPEAASAGDLLSVRARTLADEHEPLTEAGDEDERAEEAAATASPCAFAPIGQDELEALLVERARKLGGLVQYGTELTGLEQDPDGVTAQLRGPDGTTETVRAQYLIAADGAAGGVRRGLGVRTTGPGTFFHMATMHIRADLSEALRGRSVGMAYLSEPAAGTTLGPLDATGEHWFFATSRPPGSPGTDPETDPAAWVRAATGLPGLDVELLEQVPGSGGRVFTFPVGARVADRYAVGRVFLAGDTAHLMPPTGGLGGLTAVEDVHNLAWKLALVLRGSAGPELLATYETERRPVAERNMRQALARGRTRWQFPGHETDEPLLDFYALTYGYQYRSAAVPGAPDDGAPLLPVTALTAVPGSRAPHIYVSQDADPLSTLDLYGKELVLLVGPDGDLWAEAAARAAELLNTPVETYHLDTDLARPHGLGDQGALLVRPDGFVAWRSAGAADGPDAVFERVLRTLLLR
ncbi:FAD-dependent monooxygenase [Streptomyces beijiangensis]|uniref:FAD-dependent monooxygenase n=2 Tax=Streptomyces beijiangensis TaxID=163361 RepID=A0A939F9Y7_9ACTN|nr:FAD-dependent monooxygenase [Streptomyces beijiangensis]MBO0513180.1 FAD-dependent monooxygenase [Streptomyces beijiangensis]